MSLAALTSQPLVSLWSQLRQPSLHSLVHLLSTHVVHEQALPHAPQLSELLRVSTHCPLQHVSVALQLPQPPSALPSGLTHFFVAVSQTYPAAHSFLAVHLPPER